jgi:hypothetical protein
LPLRVRRSGLKTLNTIYNTTANPKSIAKKYFLKCVL